LKRGEIYHCDSPLPERGSKGGYYVIVSREFVASNDEIDTVICAPVYSNILGVRSEVIIGEPDGMSRECAIRCDFVTLLFKEELGRVAGVLSRAKMHELDLALLYALGLGPAISRRA
jgi:mRNA-degrading endonuclease toxin of MazEF toxin-antitoxin module